MNVSDRRFTIAGWGSVDPFQIGEHNCTCRHHQNLKTTFSYGLFVVATRIFALTQIHVLLAVLTNVLMQIEIIGGSIANCSKQFSSFLDFDPKIQFCAGDIRKNVKDACQVSIELRRCFLSSLAHRIALESILSEGRISRVTAEDLSFNVAKVTGNSRLLV